MKYVVVGRLSQEALREFGGQYGVEIRTFPMSLAMAKDEQARRQKQILQMLGANADTIALGKMYADVWVEDEDGNRVTSPEKRVD